MEESISQASPSVHLDILSYSTWTGVAGEAHEILKDFKRPYGAENSIVNTFPGFHSLTPASKNRSPGAPSPGLFSHSPYGRVINIPP